MSDKGKALREYSFGIFLGSMIPLFAKLVELPSDYLIFWRSAIALFVLFFLLQIRKVKLKLNNKSDFWALIFLGVLFGLNWVLFFKSVQVSSVAIGTLSLFTYPVIASLLEPFVFKERFELKNLIPALILLLGISFLVPEFSLSNQMTTGVVLGLCSSVILATRNVLVRKYTSKYDAQLILFYNILGAFLVLLPSLFMNFKSSISGSDWLYLLILGAFFTPMVHTLLVRAIRRLSARVAGVIGGLNPIFATFYAFLLFGTIPDLRTMIGGCVILSAVFIEAWRVS